jgi:hypothetical protein
MPGTSPGMTTFGCADSQPPASVFAFPRVFKGSRARSTDIRGFCSGGRKAAGLLLPDPDPDGSG